MNPLATGPCVLRRRRKPSIAAALGAAATALALLASGVSSRAQDVIDPTQPSLDAEPVFSIDSPLGPIEYRAGRGVHFGWTGLNVGGFTTVEFEQEDGEDGELALDNLNFLVALEPAEHVRGFLEVELDGLATWDMGNGDVSSRPRSRIERLYGDLVLNDALALRVGKFQTPVGRWNLTPAEPFVWTPQEPVGIETAFDEHQTGVALQGSAFPALGTLSYWLYGQVMGPLDKDESPEPGHRSVGARVQLDRDLAGWSVGTSFLATELHGDWSQLVGLDLEGQFGPLELTSEAVWQEGDIPDRDLWSVWVQGALEILPHFYLVPRIERFERHGARDDAWIYDLGAGWIPVPYLHLKGSYRLSDDETEDVRRGVKLSVSILF